MLCRDVKPQNILVSADGVVKLVDLGIAKLMRETLTRTLVRLTQEAQPAQLSPGAGASLCACCELPAAQDDRVTVGVQVWVGGFYPLFHLAWR